ncbi:MAG: tetratricopeptide repeat protein [Bacteroidales bacterium]
MKKNIAFAMFTAFILTSCSNSKDKDLLKITDIEKTVFTNTAAPFNIEKAKELVNAYTDFAKKYPKDTNSVNFLFKAANMSMNIALPKLSIELFDKIINDYPTFNKVADCMFLKAFVYDDKLKNINKAREAYEVFLRKYPTHEFADDAKACLDNLGKTTEQLIQEFEAKQKADSLVAKK